MQSFIKYSSFLFITTNPGPRIWDRSGEKISKRTCQGKAPLGFGMFKGSRGLFLHRSNIYVSQHMHECVSVFACECIQKIL